MWQALGRFLRRIDLCELPKRKLHQGLLEVNPEVSEALHHGQPVVALESTIISHGMPYPHNLRTAKKVEEIVRNNQCIPATVAILNGKICVGLTGQQLEQVADPAFVSQKVSRRDLPYIVAQKLNGSTTVSATMLIAHKVGIPLFVTGGVGGVHRGAESTLDISADLVDMGRTPVTVVSAGVKSILDIGKTLEYLETQGVCVASFGPSKDFPAFFTPKSGFQAPMNVNNPLEAAQLIVAHRELSLENGILIAVPIPEHSASSGHQIEMAIQEAISEASVQNIHGRDLTPFILRHVHKATQGASLDANIALILNNAAVGSEIAKISAELWRSKGKLKHNVKKSTKDEKVVVVGGLIVDIYSKLKNNSEITSGLINPVSSTQCFAGVGYNIANCLGKIGKQPAFVSAVGHDIFGRYFKESCKDIDISGVLQIQDQSTAMYQGFLKADGDLTASFMDPGCLSYVTPQQVYSLEEKLQNAPLVCIDGNLSQEIILIVATLCRKHNVPVWFEPTDIDKAALPFLTAAQNMFTYISPNIAELCVIYHTVTKKEADSFLKNKSSLNQSNIEVVIEKCTELCKALISLVPIIIVTMGELGVLVCRSGDITSRLPIKGMSVQQANNMEVKYFPAKKCVDVCSVSGAGDCFAASMIAGIVEGYDLDTCVQSGLELATLSLQSMQPVPMTINSRKTTGIKL
ncbi:pseudouridine-metabolizing bifunctional protein C1861.05 [Octopus sinensis]|uniref:Pseudouridine-metabolizing bifunctional protein C1861.05 n=1 Tax=Octopus sinensis TaxID=2607531 RepID=A0A6P7SAM8_9MOLL|nr:pseudouridine-metabolizing bifunctional protein C1861.05 [Octopus sinensis]XP_029635235.1 pseudouridine-metabolizing bifunctional protein C1861.05 [Octopus sinensis]XP_036357689.1 pseudouridine-metabolizing bifunctional protein C1861.05 [Octopus sinensis]XP_036357691.1 pseudouridine-metabolizing bifunctional protein C1861.05 [Octopus sinensis]